MVVSLIIIIMFRACYCSSIVSKYSQISAFDGYICSTDEIVFAQNAPNTVICSSLCSLNSSCAGIFYKGGNESCVGCSSIGTEEGRTTLRKDSGTVFIYEHKPLGESRTYDDSQYTLSIEKKTFYEARASCLCHSADLVQIDSSDEQSFLRNWMESVSFRDHIYIGLTDIETEGEYRWVDDGTKALFYDWGTNQPNTGIPNIEDCAILRFGDNFRWHDNLCILKRAFICEKK